MNNQYIMPANSKKSRLIFGLFTPIDLIVIGVGASVTFVLLLIVKDTMPWLMLTAIIPLLLAAGLVFPVPNYHNILQLLTNITNYYLGRKKYYWKGWCVKDESEDK